MLEWYRSDATSEDVMVDTEQLVAAAVRAASEGDQTQKPRNEEPQAEKPQTEKPQTEKPQPKRTELGPSRIAGAHGPIDVEPPFERLTMQDAFARYAGTSLHDALPDEERFFRIMVERIEPQLGRHRPVFLTHWPAQFASLARLFPEDPSCADRFELYVDGIELCNGFGELIDPIEQRRRLEADRARRAKLGRPDHPLDERFLAALERGLPPCAGNALGFDRLVMLAVGARDIADVIAIPEADV